MTLDMNGRVDRQAHLGAAHLWAEEASPRLLVDEPSGYELLDREVVPKRLELLDGSGLHQLLKQSL